MDPLDAVGFGRELAIPPRASRQAEAADRVCLSVLHERMRKY